LTQPIADWSFVVSSITYQVVVCGRRGAREGEEEGYSPQRHVQQEAQGRVLNAEHLEAQIKRGLRNTTKIPQTDREVNPYRA